MRVTCNKDPLCPLCEQPVPLHHKIQPCFIVEADDNNRLPLPSNSSATEIFSCSKGELKLFCISINMPHHLQKIGDLHQTELKPLSKLGMSAASNFCESANVPDRQCHWIPFSEVTNSICNDCPPICRAREQTLSFTQFLVGLFLLFVAVPLFWIPLMAIVTDHSPKGSQVCTCSVLNKTSLRFYYFTYRA